MKKRHILTKEELLSVRIEKPDSDIYARVKNNWDSIAKPIDGMGKFEEIICRVGAVQRTDRIDISRKAVVIMCADNGIVEEGISQSGQEVTLAVMKNMSRHLSSVGRMAAFAGADTMPVDIGVNSEEKVPGILDRKVMPGTRNIAREPAMTEEELLKAICTGIDIAFECKELGYKMLAAGEMGIGNTTTSSMICAALIGCEAAKVTGRGAGLDDKRFIHKREVIDNVIRKYDLYHQDAFTVLRTAGGLDLAGLSGLYIGAALSHIPVVLDGMISMAAAIAAERMIPGIKDYLLPSHMGREPGMRLIADELGMEPVIYADMALGEGTGAVMMMSMMDMAMRIYDNSTSFADISIDSYKRFR